MSEPKAAAPGANGFSAGAMPSLTCTATRREPSFDTSAGPSWPPVSAQNRSSSISTRSSVVATKRRRGPAVEGGDELLRVVVVADLQAEGRGDLGGLVQAVGDVRHAVLGQPALGRDEGVDDGLDTDCAAASKTTSGAGVGMEPSGVQSSSESSGAWPVGEARPLASSAARISAGRRTKSNASTFFSPIAASRASDPLVSEQQLLGEGDYSCTEAAGHVVLTSSRRHYRGTLRRGNERTGPVIVSVLPQETQPEEA